MRGQKIDLAKLQSIVKSYFETGKIVIPDMTYEEFILPLNNALAKAELFGSISPHNVDKITAIHGSFLEILGKHPDKLLLPYCAKPSKCTLRHEKTCECCNPEQCSIDNAFYTKHADDFENFKVPGILLDINNTTCYELKQEEDAHEGIFKGETRLDIELLQEVLEVKVDA